MMNEKSILQAAKSTQAIRKVRAAAKRSFSALCVPILGLLPAPTLTTTLVAGSAVTLGTMEDSYAAPRGVARRTTRRVVRRTPARAVRRTSVRVATLPAAATTVVIGGVTYYYANGAYWQPVYVDGCTTYVKVVID